MIKTTINLLKSSRTLNYQSFARFGFSKYSKPNVSPNYVYKNLNEKQAPKFGSVKVKKRQIISPSERKEKDLEKFK
jgi:hypothetical protein